MKGEIHMKSEMIRSLKFLFFSVSAGIIQTVSFALLNELLHLEYWVSYLVALVLSVLWNFTLNRKYTFQAVVNVPIAMLKVAVFYLVFTPLSTWWTAVLAKPNGFINEYLVELGTMLINFVLEYLYMRLFVFRNSIDAKGK